MSILRIPILLIWVGLVSLFCEIVRADIAERTSEDIFGKPGIFVPECNWRQGSPGTNTWWFAFPRIQPPKNLTMHTTWGFVSEWFVHFKVIHDRLDNLHVNDDEIAWLKSRKKALTEGIRVIDKLGWDEYQSSWQMRKYRVTRYVHENLEPLSWVMTQIREKGDRAAIYKALHQWSDALDTRLPPSGDLAFFVSNGYMEQLAKVRDDRIGYVWFDYADGYVPRLDYETVQMVMYAEGGWENANKAAYEDVHLFVTDCLAVDLMRQK